MKKFRNLRTFLVLLAFLGLSISVNSQTWYCGDTNVNGGANVTATLSSGTLIISGNGAMANFSTISVGGILITNAPWGVHQNSFTTVIIEDGVTTTGSGAFRGCSNITSVTIGNSVTTIGYATFEDCIGLTSVFIPNSITSIELSAFSNCIDLTSITIPPSVTNIGHVAFWGCTSLKKLILTNSINPLTLGEYGSGVSPFYNCPNDTIYMGRNVNRAYNNNTWALFGTGVKHLTIGNSVTFIENTAFWGCSGLTSLTIPNSVTIIGEQAFNSCIGLISVNIPNSVTSIGLGAFSHCSNLTSVFIPNSVTSIGHSAFRNCSKLISIDIPESIISIRNSTFENCIGLTSVFIPNSITSIESGAFSNCSNLTSVTIPNSVTTIGFDAFRNCTGLNELTLNNSINTLILNSNAGIYTPFYNCSIATVYMGRDVNRNHNNDTWALFGTGVKYLTIGSSVTNISGFSFSNCSSLADVIVNRATPLSVLSNIFASVNVSNVNLHTPTGAECLYATAPVWQSFNIIGAQRIIIPSAGSGGSILPNTTQTVNCGQNIPFTATPNNCQEVNQWFVNGTPVQTGGILILLPIFRKMQRYRLLSKQ